MIVTLKEIEYISNLENKQLGIPFTDALFDDSAPYYRFVYNLIKKLNPELVIELGVCTGRCTAHMAAASPECSVIGIDPYPQDISAILNEYKNISIWGLSSTWPSTLGRIDDGSVDVCFIDTIHAYDQVMAEYDLWSPKIKRGGIILFDDITLNSSMIQAWDEICKANPTREKISLPHLHHSGFGAVLMN